jgi:polyphosphate kinase
VHIGTGNYNPKTARHYEDYGLLTTDPKIGDDVASLFNHLSGYGVQGEYNRLIVAPKGLRTGLVSRIEREVEHEVRVLALRLLVRVVALEVVQSVLHVEAP